MAIQTLAVTQAPFQSYLQVTDLLISATSTDLEFVNDGYTILLVLSTATPTITVSSVMDNAGFTGSISHALTANKMEIFGPLRPIWWNQAGVVNITLSAFANTKLLPISLQF